MNLPMRSELLAFKYKDILLSSQFTEKNAINLGWKIRKRYIRHTENEEEKEALQAFADTAIHQKCIKIEGLSQANEALLQAQKWRYDPDNFEIDPPHESAWDKVQGLLNASQKNPFLVVSYLKDNIDEGINLKSKSLFSVFLKILILHLISKTSGVKIPDVRAISSIENHSEFISRVMNDMPQILELGVLVDATNIFEAMTFFGFDNIHEIKDFSQCKNLIDTEEDSFIFDLLPMSSDVLFRVSNIGNITHIHLNSRNGFIKASYDSEEKKELFHGFMKAYIMAMGHKSATEEQMKYFNSYLALSLNRVFE